jgi:transcriptional regulator with XRE-family HTH domain
MWRLRVKEEAQAHGYTLARLHRESELDIKTVRRLWHEANYNTSLATLECIADVLQVPITALIEDQKGSTNGSDVHLSRRGT